MTVFTKNRQRLMAGEVAQRLLAAVLRQAQEKNRLLSDEHFTVDGTMIQAWASRHSFREETRTAAAEKGSARTEVVARHARIEERSGGAVVQEKRRRRNRGRVIWGT